MCAGSPLADLERGAHAGLVVELEVEPRLERLERAGHMATHAHHTVEPPAHATTRWRSGSARTAAPPEELVTTICRYALSGILTRLQGAPIPKPTGFKKRQNARIPLFVAEESQHERSMFDVIPTEHDRQQH